MDNTIVDFAKAQLDGIICGKIVPNQELTDMCRVLLYAFNHGIGWIASKRAISDFADSLESTLSLVTDKSNRSNHKNIKELIDIYKDSILDHHFWNDVDVEWAHGSTGVYGKNYGEDILIKLIALSEGKVSAGEIK